MSKTTKMSAYRRFAITTAVFCYFDMKDFGEKLCEVLAESKKNLKVGEAREKSVTLKRDRDTSITEEVMHAAAAEALIRMIAEDSRVETHIADTYEFDYEDDMIDNKFASEEFDITVSGKNVVVDWER